MILLQDEWVVSRVFHKNPDVKKTPISGLLRMNSIGDDLLDCSSLPPLMDPPNYSNNNTNKPASYTDNDFKGITNTLLSSAKSSSDGYYLPTFSINNQHQLLIKPEDHRSHHIPINNYSYLSNHQSNFSNTTDNSNTLSHTQIRIQNPNPPFQQNMFSDYNNYVHQNKMNHSSMPSSVVAAASGFGGSNSNCDEDLLRAFAAKNEYLSGLDKQCKMEQSVVSVSQDTGLSNDRNTDTTSSVVSKQEMGGGMNRALYEDLEVGPSSVAPMSDLECLWDDY